MSGRIVVLTIGNEILLGKTVNTNAAFIGEQFSKLGYSVVASLVCADEKEAIAKMLRYAYSLASVVVCTGGLGPTVDDITRGAVADFFGVELDFDDVLWKKIKKYYEDRTKQKSPENNKGQAMVPKGFAYAVNPMGTAPALYNHSGKQKIFLLPGVPAEMRNFVKNLVIPELGKTVPPRDFYLQTIHIFGLPEALIAEKTENIAENEGVNLAYLPQGGYVDLRIYGENISGCQALQRKLEKVFSAEIIGYGDEEVLELLHRRLQKREVTLALAESCTGGLMSAGLVDFAGSSDYLRGSVVCYANEVKEKVLGVDAKILQEKGAVSAEVAEQMARGVSQKFESDLAVAITGVAGPSGGSQAKPVGLVWFAVYYRGEVSSFSKLFAGERNIIRHRAVEYVAGKLLQLSQ